MGRVNNKNHHLKTIAQLSVKSRQESIKDNNQEINSANELNELIDNIHINNLNLLYYFFNLIHFFNLIQ
jgi:mannitol/fructose-specific phosphotransferase system IIA component (Ntr-type)